MTSNRLAVLVSHPIQYFAPWYRAIAARGDIELLVLYCCDWGTEPYADPGFGVDVQWDVPLTGGYRHTFLPIARRPRRLGFWEVDNPGVAAALREFRPDALLVHGYAHRTLWRAVRWANSQSVPVLLYSDSNALERRPFWKRWAKRVVLGRFYSMVSAALSVGDNNTAYHKQYGVDEERIFRCTFPVDLGRFFLDAEQRRVARNAIRAEFGIPLAAFVLLFSGKLISRKRPLDVVNAAARLRQLGVWALLVGDGELGDKVRLGAAQAGCVAMAGFINQRQIPQVYAAGDLLVVPSSRDAHPLVVPEAMALGIPAVVSDQVGCVGPSDHARPGVNCLTYVCGDVNALCSRIEQVLSDPELRRSLAKGAREMAADQSPIAAAELLARAVASVLAQRAGRNQFSEA